MPFYPPSWVPQLPAEPNSSISIGDFMLDEQYGRCAHANSRNPFTCGVTGKTYSSAEVKQRVDYLARGLAKELGFEVNKGSEWDKVIAVFSLNTVSAAAGIGACLAVLTRDSSIHFLLHGRHTVWAASRRLPTLPTAPLSSSTSSRAPMRKPSSPAFRCSALRARQPASAAFPQTASTYSKCLTSSWMARASHAA